MSILTNCTTLCIGTDAFFRLAGARLDFFVIDTLFAFLAFFAMEFSFIYGVGIRSNFRLFFGVIAGTAGTSAGVVPPTVHPFSRTHGGGTAISGGALHAQVHRA